jgi:hypothetical protein
MKDKESRKAAKGKKFVDKEGRAAIKSSIKENVNSKVGGTTTTAKRIKVARVQKPGKPAASYKKVVTTAKPAKTSMTKSNPKQSGMGSGKMVKSSSGYGVKIKKKKI